MYIDRVHQRNNENVVTEGSQLADSIHIQPQLSKCALIGFQTCYKDAFFFIYMLCGEYFLKLYTYLDNTDTWEVLVHSSILFHHSCMKGLHTQHLQLIL